ncbi:metal-dependent transcriptional regulator [Subtercola endophyticus]|uniref:metal-dependent transcriptional regulator n=1 Tax=Subtercola endophyticus TaxID=2895559 RepID=UPI0028BDD0E2|nr:metal-dependent transcriptional regulator [Subtercola endophyticus]
MPVSSLTTAAQDYLKVIWAASEWSSEPITVKQLADRTGVSTATVSDGIRKLAGLGMLEHEPYGSIELTDSGRSVAVQMVRRHRLVETFLVEMLGYSWDEVHDEAEVLEHAVSDTLVDRIDRRLGFPARDPHGDPIPSAAGDSVRLAAVRLSAADAGHPLVVSRISDADAEVLRYAADRGVLPGVRLTVLAASDAAAAAAAAAAAPGDGGVAVKAAPAGAADVGAAAGGVSAPSGAGAAVGAAEAAAAAAPGDGGVAAKAGLAGVDVRVALDGDPEHPVAIVQRAADAIWVTEVEA